MVTLYSQPGCPQCKMVHLLLNKKNIKFTEVQDVDKMLALGLSHTPTLEVNGQFLVGKEIFNFINGN